MIQQSINQGLSLAGLVISQTPQYKEAAEVRQLASRGKREIKQARAAIKNLEDQDFEEAVDKAVGTAKEIYERKPTGDTYEKYQKAKKLRGEMKDARQAYREAFGIKAEKMSDRSKESLEAERARFLKTRGILKSILGEGDEQ